ncbi:MAG: serine/threonine-protein kinase [Gemmataceae bacterium]
MQSKTAVRMPNTPFLKLIVKSGLLAPDDLISVLSHYDPAEVEAVDPIHLATFLVRKKLLTKYQAMQLLSGRSGGFLLGRYKILEGIRQDRVGMLFLGESKDSGQKVSVKVIPTERISDKAAFENFLEEIRLAASINHSSVAQIFDIGELTGTHYVVSELVTAPTLDSIIAQHGPIAPKAAIMIVAQVAVGLQKAHSIGLFHRDLKPGNIALLPDMRIKLLDLGLTNLMDDPWKQNTKRISQEEYALEITHIPPEQGLDQEFDCRSDLYSLGSTLYYLLTGKPAFPGLAIDSMAARQTQDIPPPSLIQDGIPSQVDQLIAKLGARDRNQRLPSAADLIAMVYPWVPAEEWTALGVPAPRPIQKQPVRRVSGAKRVHEEKAASDVQEKAAGNRLFASIRRFFGR